MPRQIEKLRSIRATPYRVSTARATRPACDLYAARSSATGWTGHATLLENLTS